MVKEKFNLLDHINTRGPPIRGSNIFLPSSKMINTKIPGFGKNYKLIKY